MISGEILCHDAGHGQQATAPNQARDHKGKQPCWTHATILFFTFNAGVNKLHEVCNIIL